MNMNNPYIPDGTPAEGDFFVGRHERLQEIKDKLLIQSHVSLAGLGRVGKTSLGRKVLNSIAHEHPEIITKKVSMNAFRKGRSLLKVILSVFFPDDGFDLPNDPDDSYLAFGEILRKKKKAGFKGILLIDEFDKATEYENSLTVLDWLREIACERNELGLTFLFISRRSLDRIQAECKDGPEGSNLYGICDKFFLQPFDKNETRELVALSKLDLNEEFLETLYVYTGGYPFLLEKFMNRFYDLYRRSPEKKAEELFPEAYLKVRHDFLDLFHDIRRFLSNNDGKAWKALCSEFIPPKEREADSETMQLFMDYGLINENTKSSCLSDTFCDYIQAHQNHLSMWEPLSNLEKALRIVVKEGLKELYGDHWFEAAPKNNPYYEKTFSELNERASDYQRRFNVGGPDDLLEYSYPGTIKDIIIMEWDTYFKNFFGNDKNQFKESMNAVHTARNLLSHSRRTALIPEKTLLKARIAIDYLNKFLDRPHD